MPTYWMAGGVTIWPHDRWDGGRGEDVAGQALDYKALAVNILRRKKPFWQGRAPNHPVCKSINANGLWKMVLCARAFGERETLGI
jgi:hypothetical protein